MDELGLCAGNGGLSLGLRLAVPSARTVCLVERESVAVADLVAKMEAGTMDAAPIWTDLATFDGNPWRGSVDLVSAGFPCQPFSAAGRVKGTKDERWLWPDIERVIGECEPGYVFIENVPGLVFHGLHDVVGGLAQLGFNAVWSLFSAAEVGAPHIRDRLFLLAAHADRGGLAQEWCAGLRDGEQERRPDPDGRHRALPNAHSEPVRDVGQRVPRGRAGRVRAQGGTRAGDNGQDGAVADADGDGRDQGPEAVRPGQPVAPLGGEAMADADGQGPPEREHVGDPAGGWSPAAGGSWWATEPPVGRVVDGTADRVDRLRSLGNGVVPLVVAHAFRTLAARLALTTI